MGPDTTAKTLAAIMAKGPLVDAATAMAGMAKVIQEFSIKMTTVCPCCSTGPSQRRLPPASLWSPQLVEDLRGSARAIRRRGWIRNQLVTEWGVCAAGGAMVAISGLEFPQTPAFDLHKGRADWGQRLNVWAEAMNYWLGSRVTSFNDQVATGPHEMIAELELCADAIERQLTRRTEWTYDPEPRRVDVVPVTIPEEWLQATVDVKIPEAWTTLGILDGLTVEPKVLEPA